MPEHLVTLEMKELIEELRFSADGSIHILLHDGRRSNCCGKLRFWFINREGSTLCFDCDDKVLAARAQGPAELAGRRWEATRMGVVI